MGEVTKVDTFAEPPENPSQPKLSPEQIQNLAHQAKQGARATASSQDKVVHEERPGWLPPKFKSAEDLAKAYSELEKKMGQQGAQKAPEAAKTEPGKAPEGKSLGDLKVGEKAPEGTVPDEKAAEAVVTKAGLNMAELNAEFQKAGDLSAESYKKLEAAGITKDVVATYIEGQKALVATRIADIESIAGGHEQFSQMHTWSTTNLSDTEKAAINKAVESGDHQAIKLAFQGVHAKWVAAGQNEPTGQIRGTKTEPTTGDVYTHRDEILKDMKNPEYKTSEAFRQKVMAKIQRSKVW